MTGARSGWRPLSWPRVTGTAGPAWRASAPTASTWCRCPASTRRDTASSLPSPSSQPPSKVIIFWFLEGMKPTSQSIIVLFLFRKLQEGSNFYQFRELLPRPDCHSYSQSPASSALDCPDTLSLSLHLPPSQSLHRQIIPSDKTPVKHNCTKLISKLLFISISCIFVIVLCNYHLMFILVFHSFIFIQKCIALLSLLFIAIFFQINCKSLST